MPQSRKVIPVSTEGALTAFQKPNDMNPKVNLDIILKGGKGRFDGYKFVKSAKDFLKTAGRASRLQLESVKATDPRGSFYNEAAGITAASNAAPKFAKIMRQFVPRSELAQILTSFERGTGAETAGDKAVPFIDGTTGDVMSEQTATSLIFENPAFVKKMKYMSTRPHYSHQIKDHNGIISRITSQLKNRDAIMNRFN